MRLLAHLKVDELKEDHFPCPAFLTLNWTPQGSRLGGPRLDFVQSVSLILSGGPPTSHTFRWPTKKLKDRGRQGGVLPSLNITGPNQKLKGRDKEGEFLWGFQF